MKTIGVIGAGVMGIGVAQSLADSNHNVLLLDVSDEILGRAKKEIRNNLRLRAMLKKNGGAASIDETLDRITTTTDTSVLADADFVIENVTEKWEIKQRVYEEIDPICPPRCVFAANTSAIPITRIAATMKQPERVLGMHFMNPVPMKPVVEVIRGYHTAEETIQTALNLLTQMGKEGVVVNDSPGFVSNRVLMLTINEATFLVHERVASPEDIDKIFQKCFGHTMGPLATADLIGVDTILLSLEVLYESFADSKYRPCPLLKQMVDAGHLGRKAGRGFFTY
jgi:3-hydroxybutyryl-CoA dehydrogenase